MLYVDSQVKTKLIKLQWYTSYWKYNRTSDELYFENFLGNNMSLTQFYGIKDILKNMLAYQSIKLRMLKKYFSYLNN